MYRCESCNQVIPPHTASHRLVVETRPAVYPYRPDANRVRLKHKTETRDDRGGVGREIARERIACPACAAKQ